MTFPRAACSCCGGGCCQCWQGEDRHGGGCCYSTGNRMRLTIPRPGIPTGKFGGVSAACFYDCFAPLLAHTFCCGEQGNDPAEEFWVEYEWQEPCVVMEFAKDEQIVPTPPPFAYPLPGDGSPPPGDGEIIPPTDPRIFCHVVHVFVAVEYSASIIAFGDAGGDIGCIVPLEWWYVCSGCEKFPDMADCAVPQDWRPESELPCGYVGPDGDFFRAAEPAKGWAFVCDPVQPYPCPFCIGACIVGPITPCVSFTTTGGQILDEFGSPLYCEVDACTGDPCCSSPAPYDPSCFTTITADFTRCDGVIICCHMKQQRRISCDPADGYYCFDLGISTTTLKRVDQRACVWQEDPVAKCRPRKASDPDEPIDLPPCPP